MNNKDACLSGTLFLCHVICSSEEQTKSRRTDERLVPPSNPVLFLQTPDNPVPKEAEPSPEFMPVL